MSKQTINIGASPNDGTGTPLRTSFDYTNQNFTELYTALGGGVGLPGATTQVIFNDGGTNLAGDAGLVYNKTTDALTIAGLVTAGSATITGDLTVRTNKLAVTSTGVGFGTTSPNASFQATISGLYGLRIQSADTNNSALNIGNDPTSGYAFIDATKTGSGSFLPLRFSTSDNERYRIAADGVATWSNVGGTSGTAMTLNANGLGIGGTVITTNFEAIASSSGSLGGTATVSNIAASAIGNAASFNFRTNANFRSAGYSSARIEAVTPLASNNTDLVFYNYKGATNSGDETMRITSSGNVGIGVTPSVKLDVLSAAAEGTIRLTSTIDGSNASPKASSLSLRSGSASVETARISSFNRFTNVGGGDLVFSTQDTSNILQARATIDSSGQFNIGTSSSLGCRLTVVDTVNNAIVGKNTTALSGVYVAWNAATALDNVFMAFGTETAFAGRGSITYNRAGGLVAYNTTSDYRSKDIIGPVSNSGSLIDSLKVYVGKMKGATVARPMLIAHEAQEIAPYSVTGVKDEVDADGKDKYQQMDVSSFVPLLIAEIQSLRTRVQTLEAR